MTKIKEDKQLLSFWRDALKRLEPHCVDTQNRPITSETISYEASNAGFRISESRVDRILKGDVVPTIYDVTALCNAVQAEVGVVLSGYSGLFEGMKGLIESIKTPASDGSVDRSELSNVVEMIREFIVLDDSQQERLLGLVKSMSGSPKSRGGS